MKENIDALFEVKLELKKGYNKAKSQTESLAGHLEDTEGHILEISKKS